MRDRRWRSPRLLLPSLAVAVGLAAAAVSGLRPLPEGVTVTFFDVGQGDAIHIRDGSVDVIVDGGPSSNVAGLLRRDLPATDRTLELVVATHPDADHITGLASLVGVFEVRQVLEPDVPSKTKTAQRWHETVARAGLSVIRPSIGQRFSLPHGTLTVLWPRVGLNRPATNDHSIVLRLDVGDDCVLLAGDATNWVEEQLEQDLEPCDVLKVGHHGSASSTSESFLEALAPKEAVISVGARNRYGHPAPSVLSRLERHGVRVWRTDISGTLRLKLMPVGRRMDVSH